MALAVALLLPGCSVLLEYDESVDEDTALRCADGADNDLDGLVDCLDPDCRGLCPEEGRVACDNGADDDGDGRVDAADASCWPDLPPALRRCASVGRTRFRSTLDSQESLLGAWFVASGSVVDANAAAVGGALRFDGSERGSIGTFRTFQGGARDGLSLSLVVFVPFEGGVQISLVPEGAAPVGGPPTVGGELLSLRVDPDLATLRFGARSSQTPIDVAGWVHVSLRATEGAPVDARVEPLESLGTGEGGRLPPIVAPETISASRIFIGGDPGVAVRAFAFDVGGADPCGREVPELAAGGLRAERDAGHQLSIAANDTGYCALVTTCNGDDRFVRAFTSGDGAAWERAAFVVEEDAFPASVGVAYDPDAGEYLAVLRVKDAGPSAARSRLLVTRSADCRSWSTPVDVGLPTVESGDETRCPAVEPHAASYVVRSLRVSSGSRQLVGAASLHEVFWTAHEPDALVLVRAASADGGRSFGRPEAWARFDDGVRPPISITSVGTDLLATHRSSEPGAPPGIAVRVSSVGRVWAPILSLGPSGIPRTFDRSDVVAGSVAVGPSGARLLYGARGDFAETAGTVAQEVSPGTAELVF